MRMKYWATIEFGYGIKPIQFTAVELSGLMKRFNKEVDKEVERRREAQSYTFVEPNLTVQVK